MSWFLNEINEAGDVRLCMEDGRLLYGHSIGVDTKGYPEGIMAFESEGIVYHFVDVQIADYIQI